MFHIKVFVLLKVTILPYIYGMVAKYGKLLLVLCALLLVALVLCWVIGYTAPMGFLAIGFFLSLALGVRSHSFFKGFSFTILIFAAVVASMCYPERFVQIGSFQLKQLIVPLLMVIMFGMGTSMSLQDFRGVIKMPKGVLVGVVCQFSIMPLVGYGLAYLSGFPPEIAAGIILVGCSPSGLASNVISGCSTTE